MARPDESRPTPWAAFAAGAVAMLAVGLLWCAWQGRDEAAVASRVAAQVLPKVSPPRLPIAPHLPDAPVPVPK